MIITLLLATFAHACHSTSDHGFVLRPHASYKHKFDPYQAMGKGYSSGHWSKTFEECERQAQEYPSEKEEEGEFILTKFTLTCEDLTTKKEYVVYER